MRNGDDEGCTTRQHNAHITDSRKLLYPWHPWYGRTVLIFSSISKYGHALYRCGLKSAQTERSLEVPQWMFDTAICSHIHLSAAPIVRYEQLRELRRLLTRTDAAFKNSVIQGEHCSSSITGGIDATEQIPEAVESTQSFSCTPKHPTVGELAAGDAPSRDATSGSLAAPTLPAIARRSSRTGGVR